MDFGHMNVVSKWCECTLIVDLWIGMVIIINIIITIIVSFFLAFFPLSPPTLCFFLFFWSSCKVKVGRDRCVVEEL